MDDNSNNKSTTYEVVDFKTTESKKGNGNFANKVIVPFISGIVGASLVIGVCFGVPEIKQTILKGNNSEVLGNTSNSNSSTSSGTVTRSIFIKFFRYSN